MHQTLTLLVLSFLLVLSLLRIQNIICTNKYDRHQQVIRDEISSRELRSLQNQPEYVYHC